MRDAFLQVIREARSSKPSSIAGLPHPNICILVRQGSAIETLRFIVEKQAFKHPARKLFQILSALLKRAFEILGTEAVLELGRHGVKDLVKGEYLNFLKGAEVPRTSLSSSTVISLAKLSPYSSTAPSIRDSDSAVV